MHSPLVCVTALCFFRLCVAVRGESLCPDCRVHVVYPGGAKNGQQLYRNQRIVRIINDYRRVNGERGGSRLQDSNFSFIAKVRVSGSIRCSAALVAPHVVISSNACCRNESVHQLQILFSGGRTLAVDIMLNPKFCPELCLLHLKSRSDIQPVTISQRSPKLGQNVSMVMASPDLSFYGRRPTQIIENRACKISFQEEESAYITPNMMCAKNSMKTDRCANNPGDGLLMDHQLCGINAYGSRCRPNSLNGDLYIDLAKLQPMIGDIIHQLNG
ncbi:hypothetical protein KR054_005116 [Drosophila jambulina]|nr:hypothetical protein KR054_005116 [Drosophila jambulina]